VAQKLVDAKVNGVIGHLNSGTTVPASKIYNDAGIPQISPATTATQYTQAALPGRLPRRRERRQARRHAGQVRDRYAEGEEHRRHRRPHHLRPGRGRPNSSRAPRAGRASIVGKEFTSAKATDYTAILTSIKAKKPDLVFFGGMDSVGGPMLKQMKALGINAKFMGGDGICTEALGRLAGDASATARSSAPKPAA
jgi:branched-chain amino acid transport system substrate-binding protein